MIQKANKAENKTWKMVGPVVVLTCIGLVITAAVSYTHLDVYKRQNLV